MADGLSGTLAVGHGGLPIDAGNRTLAEAEAALPGPTHADDLEDWDDDAP